MNLAVSNIAWEPKERPAIIDVLRSKGVNKIEAAPVALFGHPLDEITESDVFRVRDEWEKAGITIVAMQALLFGKRRLSLFQSEHKRAEMAAFLRKIIDTASLIGAEPLVFGSPKNRLRGELSMSEAMRIAARFFSELAQYADDKGCVICIEPNAAGYGCDFITHLHEAAELVSAVNKPGLGLQVDTGVMSMNGEEPNIIADFIPLVAHVHCSEPYLEPITQGDEARHRTIGDILFDRGYTGMISIEMKRSDDHDNTRLVADGIDFAIKAYSALLRN